MWLFREPPLRLSVSSQQIQLLYRLPWLDRQIAMSHINSARIERHNYFNEGGGQEHFYILFIEHDGTVERLRGNQRPWYQEQMKAAYNAIELNLARLKKVKPTATRQSDNKG
jgi:hypothetical protein